MDEEIIDYKEFLNRLNLEDDKISLLLYDLYKYGITNKDEEETTK